MMRLFPVGMAALLAFALTAPALAASDADECVIIQHYYFPIKGKEAQALALRKRSAELRRRLGLPTGRILELRSSVSGHPAKGPLGPGNASFIMSEVEFANQAAVDHYNQTLLASPDYIAIRGQMAKLLRHFEMAVRTPADGACRPDRP